MDVTTARLLAGLTRDFYSLWGRSFSATRDHPWNGWTTCLPYIESLMGAGTSPLTVLDLACGNLRFRDFLHTNLPAVPLSYHGVDMAETPGSSEEPMISHASPSKRRIGRSPSPISCDGRPEVQVLDIMEALFSSDLDDQLLAPSTDLSVCFGFLHHVPLPSLRRDLIETLVRHTRRRGMVILTAWQFARDDLARTKAEAFTAHASTLLEARVGHTPGVHMEEGDYLLGWQGSDEALRYCHSFSEAEIDDLICHVEGRARPIARFRADGKTGAANNYLIFQVE